MKKHRSMLWIFSMTFLMGAQTTLAQRSQYLLDKEWKFRFSHQVEKNTPQPISLPHTWNAQDALVGKIYYKRGIGNYERTLHIRPEWKGKRLFLRFGGVNNVADVFVNGISIGKQQPDAYGVVCWKNVPLQPGSNRVEVRAGQRKNLLHDTVELDYIP